MLLDSNDMVGPPRFDFDPTTGEVFDLNDSDDLISTYERVDKKYQILKVFRQDLAHAMANKTEGDTATRYLRGILRRAKITMPPDLWEQSILKEAWNAYPKHSAEFLRIERIAVKLREWKKLKATTAAKDLESFKGMISRAERPATGTPQIKVEK